MTDRHRRIVPWLIFSVFLAALLAPVVFQNNSAALVIYWIAHSIAITWAIALYFRKIFRGAGSDKTWVVNCIIIAGVLFYLWAR